MDQDIQNARFVEWLEDHRGIVVKVARSFATGRDVDDLVQEILVRLWKSASTFRGDSAPSTWIYRVALNRALTWQRDEKARRARTRPVAEIADFAAPSTLAYMAIGVGGGVVLYRVNRRIGREKYEPKVERLSQLIADMG